MITYRFKKVLSALLIMMLVLGNIFIPITDSNTGLGIADVSAAPRRQAPVGLRHLLCTVNLLY